MSTSSPLTEVGRPGRGGAAGLALAINLVVLGGLALTAWTLHLVVLA